MNPGKKRPGTDSGAETGLFIMLAGMMAVCLGILLLLFVGVPILGATFGTLVAVVAAVALGFVWVRLMAGHRR